MAPKKTSNSIRKDMNWVLFGYEPQGRGRRRGQNTQEENPPEGLTFAPSILASPVCGVLLRRPTTGQSSGTVSSFDELDLSPVLASINISEATKQDSECDINLFDPDDMLVDSELLQPGSYVRAVLGYANSTVQDFGEYLIKEAEHQWRPEGSVLTLKAQTKLITFAQSDGAERYDGSRASDIATLIAARYGLQAEVADTAFVYPELIRAGESEGNFLKRLAKLYGYDFYIENNTLHFHPPRDFRGPIVLEYRPEDPLQGTLLEFQAATEKTKKGRKKKAENVDTNQGEGYKKDPEESQTPPERVAEQSIQQRGGEPQEQSELPWAVNPLTGEYARPEELFVGKVLTAIPAETQELLTAMERVGKETVEVSGKCYGIPYLRRGRTIEVRGVGSLYSMIYLLDEVTHEFSEQGYFTSFSAKARYTGKPVKIKDIQVPQNLPLDNVYQFNSRTGEWEGTVN